MFTKRTKAILNSIVVRLRATENTKVKFENTLKTVLRLKAFNKNLPLYNLKEKNFL